MTYFFTFLFDVPHFEREANDIKLSFKVDNYMAKKKREENPKYK